MSTQEHPKTTHAPFRRAAVWMVAAVAVSGAILSWASIQGGSISRWIPERAPVHQASAAIATPAADTKELLARGLESKPRNALGVTSPTNDPPHLHIRKSWTNTKVRETRY